MSEQHEADAAEQVREAPAAQIRPEDMRTTQEVAPSARREGRA